MKTPADLAAWLGELHRRTAETPIFNPVFQLSLDLSRRLESGELDLAAFADLVAAQECDGLKSRAARLQRLVTQAHDGADPLSAENAEDFAAFRARWEHPQLHAVFTAHPTFLLTQAQSQAVAMAASAPGDIADTVCGVPAPRQAITLEHEHRAAMGGDGPRRGSA